LEGASPVAKIEHVQVKAPADPGIGGGILDLGLGEVTAGPVGNLGPFGDPEIEEEPGKAAEAGVEDASLLGEVGDFHESPGLEILQIPELLDIVGDGDTSFDDLPVGKELPETVKGGQLLYLEEPDAGFPGQLDEGGLVILALFEGGPGLRVKSEDGFPAEVLEGSGEAGGALYKGHWAFVGFEGKRVDLLLGNLD